MHTTLDTIAHTNRLRHSDTRLKVIFVAITVLITVASTSPITPLVSFIITGILIVCVAKIPPKTYLLLLSAPLFFGLLALLLMSLFFGYGNPIYHFELLSHTLNITSEGVNMGLLVLSRTLAGSSGLFFLALTTPMTELFAVLRQLRIPDVVIELSMLIYRYIFVFLEEAERMWLAQQTRGVTGFHAKIKAFSMLTSSLFLRGMQKGEKLFIAMNARCYDGEPHTLNFQPHKTRISLKMLSAILIFESLLGILAILTRNTTLL